MWGLRQNLTVPKHEKRVLCRRNVDVFFASTKIDQNARSSKFLVFLNDVWHFFLIARKVVQNGNTVFTCQTLLQIVSIRLHRKILACRPHRLIAFASKKEWKWFQLSSVGLIWHTYTPFLRGPRCSLTIWALTISDKRPIQWCKSRFWLASFACLLCVVGI
jgi:hypothetical protein